MFSHWMQAHRRSIIFLVTILALGGVFAAWNLPVALFPHVTFPRASLTLDSGDRTAERMMVEVTLPVENAVRAVPGVKGVISATSRGSAEVTVAFDWGLDMVAAVLQIESAVSKVMPELPTGTSFDVRRMDPNLFPCVAYSLTSENMSLPKLRDIARFQLRPLLSTVNGVSNVEILGGADDEIRVTVDPSQLDARGLALADISKALAEANVVEAVGRLEDHYKLYLAVSDSHLASSDDAGSVIVQKGTNGVVRLRDIAKIEWTTAPNWTRVTADGRDAVSFEVHQQPEGNTVQIAKDVKAILAEFKPQLPAGVEISNWYDQSELVVASAKSVRDAVLIGVGLSCVVLLIFLRNFKTTLIAIICVPTSLAATVLLMKLLNMSFNIMTLGGMAAAVGLIIDDAIVMMEHVIRRLRGCTGPHHGVVLHAASEFTRPLAGSSACTIIIFAPLAFLSGVTGAFFKALSLTMAASLAISFLISLLAVPILSDHLLNAKDANQKEGGKLTDLFHRGYTWLMSRLLARPWLVLLGVIPLLAAGWVGYSRAGTGFMPAMDEGGFILDYTAEPGTSLTETDRLLRQLEEVLQDTPEVQTYSRRTGLQLGGFLTEAYTGDIFVRLKPQPRRHIEEVMDEVRENVEAKVPGLEIEFAQLMEDVIGDLTAVPQPIEIKLYAAQENVLNSLAPQVATIIEKIPGIVDIKDGIVLAGDALNIEVDSDRAALEGMGVDEITGQLTAFLDGIVATSIQHGPKMVGFRVWIPQDNRASADGVGELKIRATDGHLFPLKRVAKIETQAGQPEIMRDNLKRTVSVTARITGRDLGSVAREVKAALEKPGALPNGVYFRLGGVYAEQQAAFTGLIAVFAGAVALVFLLLLFLYEQVRIALATMLTTLLALAAVMIGLWITDTEINISAMMGMTMVIGIATEVAIFLISEFIELPPDMPRADALIAAGKNRMRPIAMTTFAAILALLPLALGFGQGAQMQRPLAIAIVSGLCAQLPLVLIILPVILHITKPRISRTT